VYALTFGVLCDSRHADHRAAVLLGGYCFEDAADPRLHAVLALRERAGHAMHALLRLLAVRHSDDAIVIRGLLKVRTHAHGQRRAAHGCSRWRAVQAVRIYMVHRGATASKVSQRLQGYRYLKSLLVSRGTQNKGAVRFLLGTCRHAQSFGGSICCHVTCA
jgi:hypothetical protein